MPTCASVRFEADMQTARTAWGESLACEYLRLLLTGIGACYAIYWTAIYWTGQAVSWSLLGIAGEGNQASGDSPIAAGGLAMVGLFVLGSSVLAAVKANRTVPLTTAVVAIAFLLVLVLREYTRATSFEHFAPFSPVASIVYVAGVFLLTVMQLDQPAEDFPEQPQPLADSDSLSTTIAEDADASLIPSKNRRIANLARWLVGGSVAALLLYMVAWPAAQWMLGLGEFSMPTTVGDQLTLGQEFRVRSAKLAVFLIFVAFGASFGSFLHVIAHTLPRGQGVPLRSSACPVCNTKIRRLDNVPIFSYLLLRGRCRDCGTEIPVRYLWAEMLMAALFASFFLLELVIGAKNLPGFREVYYTGIVWVILYTKWDIVGIVGYHLFLYMAVLTTIYANWQSRRMPWYFWGVMFLAAACLPLFFHFLLPMKLTTISSLSAPLLNGLTSLAGGLAGAMFGGVLAIFFSWYRSRPVNDEQSADDDFCLSSGEILPAGVLLGLGLGWQAVLGTMVILCLLLFGLYCFRFGGSWLVSNGLLPVLLLSGIVHQFAWKWLVKFGQPVWLHQNSPWMLAAGFAVVTMAGLFFVSRGWKLYLLKVDYDG